MPRNLHSVTIAEALTQSAASAFVTIPPGFQAVIDWTIAFEPSDIALNSGSARVLVRVPRASVDAVLSGVIDLSSATSSLLKQFSVPSARIKVLLAGYPIGKTVAIYLNGASDGLLL